MLVVPDTAACYLLDHLIDSVDPYIHLYATDVWPTRGTVVGDLVEPDWSGYAPVRVNTWTGSLIADGQAQSTADPVEWVRGLAGDPQSVYGYYITDGESGPLLWAEHVCGVESIGMDAEGDVVVVWPLARLTYEPSEPCIASGGVEISGDSVP